jgi:SAM-dependent methyltransferase
VDQETAMDQETATNATARFYRIAYRVGFHPWEDAEHDPAFVGTFTELIEREEKERTPPFGHALDVGTGAGIWAIALARRGWQVTGIDNVPRALRRARERVRASGVEVRLVEGDVTRLRATGVGDGYHLVLDTGTFHGLEPAQRRAMGREIDAAAAPDATVLLIAWEPKRRGPLPRGVGRAEIETAFPGWKVTDVEPSHYTAPAPVEKLLTPGEHWYRLRRE